MTARPGLLAHPFSVATILVFTGLLVFALWRLFDTEVKLRVQAGDNMLWTISQAQVAAHRLDIALGRAQLGEPSLEELQLRYDVLLSRLNLLEAGPQQRYLAGLGQFKTIEALSSEVYAAEAAFLGPGQSDYEHLQTLLAKLAAELGVAANRAMVAQWDETGSQLDRQRAAVLQAIAAVIGILALGALISWRMLAALDAKQRAQMSLLREQEIREAYRSFVMLVSHQFRTPLAVIDSSMQRILRQGASLPYAQIEKRAMRVRKAVQSLADLIQATLDSMRLEAGQIEIRARECEIAAELEKARDQQQEAQEAPRILIMIADEVPARLVTDPLLLQQILGNLLANAISYSPRSEHILLRARAYNRRLFIDVEDQGVGIPQEEQEGLFQPFFRASTTARTRGVGLGLHLSRRLARLLGGDLTFTSQQGFGSTFTLELPL